jgi:hypothetical protein
MLNLRKSECRIQSFPIDKGGKGGEGGSDLKKGSF